jgi:3-oxoacyl-[acyl-carrier protein] reductase
LDTACIKLGVMDFAGKVALVTGGSGGIGAELSRQLGQAGATVAVHYHHGEDAARAVAADLPRAAVFQADLSQPELDLVERVEAELGPVDILAANAGHGSRGSWREVDAAAFDEMYAVNLRAPFLLAQRVLPGMIERGYGRILFTSSIAGLTGGIVGPHYAATKAALHGLTHHLASRVARDGVTVNALAPALIEDTNMLPGDPGELAARIPAGRLGTPQEVADLALAMLRNGYLTSKVIALDGGLYAT